MAGNQALYPKLFMSVTEDGSLNDNLILDHATYGLLDGTRDWALNLYELTEYAGVMAMQVRRGRRNMRDQVQAGTCTLVVDNTAGSITASALRIGQEMGLWASDGATDTKVFTGELSSVAESKDPRTGTTLLSITGVDWLRRLTDWESAPEGFTGEGETVTNVILRALDPIRGEPGYQASIETSTVTLGTQAWEGTIASVIADCVFADGGYWYCDRFGVQRFRARGTIYAAAKYASPVVTIASSAAAPNPARAFENVYSPDRVINQVRLTNSTGVSRTGFDGGSQTYFGKRSLNRNTTNNDTSYTQSLADLYTAVWARQATQWAPIEVHAATGDWVNDLPSLELTDALTINDGTDVDVILEGIEHSWKPAEGWTAKLHTNRAVPEIAS